MKILDEIEARAKAATEGPWEVSESLTGIQIYSSTQRVVEHGTMCVNVCRKVINRREGYELPSTARARKDLSAIAHSRTDVPRLCKALRYASDMISDEAMIMVEDTIERILKGGGE